MATYRSFTSAAALLLCATAAMAQAPANDDCTGAIAAGLGNTPWDGTNATDGAGQALDPLVCNMGIFGDDQIYADVWFTFSPPVSGVHSINSINGGMTFDSRVAVYDSAACPDDPALVLYCNDDVNAFFEAGTSGWLDAGSTYTIRLGSFNAVTVAQPAILEITALGPVPANDDCSTAVAASLGLTNYDTLTASNAGVALDPMVCDMGPNGDEQIYSDIWFTFTPATTDFYDIVAINNGNPDYDSALAVYSSTACPDDPALVIACDDDSGLGVHAAITSLSLTAATDYLIRVGSFEQNTVENPATLSIAIGNPPTAPPANDDCATAINAPIGGTNFDTTGATDGTGLALDPLVCDMGIFGDDQIYADAWFNFTATATGNFQFGIVSNGVSMTYDSRIAIYDQTTCPDDPNLVIACDDDAGGALQAQATAALINGQSYTVRVGSYNAVTAAEPALLNIVFLGAAIANDDCASATAITNFGVYNYDTSIATTDGAPMGGLCTMGTFGDDQIHRDVWYEYTPTVGGCTYISTLGLAGYDSRMAVYTGATCPNDPASILVCNDDEVQPLDGIFEAGLDVDLVAGTTYLIRVGTYNTATLGGATSLLISAGPLADVNNGTGIPQVGAPGCVPPSAFNEFCFGDGGNQMGCTNCPCANEAPIGSGGGCLNSGGSGTKLTVSGDPSVSLPSGDTTDLRFGAEGAPATAFCILNSGDGLAPGNMANPCFGLNTGAQAAAFDGLRCAIMNTRRHGGRSADGNGDVGVTNNPWGGEGGPPVGIAQAGGGFASGQTRFFQIINRDDPLAVCTRALNTSQAVEVMFTP